MADIVDRKTRSRMMSGIRSKNTKPEILIRKALFARGFRYRLHRKDLPGKPDIILPRYKAVILVNGCFWHYHACHIFKMPSTRREWWERKLSRNRQKDNENLKALLAGGWRVCIIWECSLRGSRAKDNFDSLMDRLQHWICSDTQELVIGES